MNTPARSGSFLSDIKTLRERARQHIEQGAVTDELQRGPPTVLKLLNEALATEIVCVLRYKRHYFMATGIDAEGGRGGIPASTRTRSRATPTRSPSASCSSAASRTSIPTGSRRRSHAEYVEGENLIDMIKEDLVAERIAIDSYREMINYIGDKDTDHQAHARGHPRGRGRARRRSRRISEKNGFVMAKAVRIPRIRTGQGVWPLTRKEFERRFLERYFDPRFELERGEIEKLTELAWRNYCETRKAPRTRKAGAAFKDPEFELSVQWLDARKALRAAELRQRKAGARSRILLICGASRNDKTCPGEMSKTFRLVTLAKKTLQAQRFEVDVLDLSALISEFGRVIYPCKACVSTAMPLCHWPCSCYPNHALGQTNDWMNEIYPTLGRGARHHDRDAGVLVSGAEWPEADDGPAGVRRRRQPRSHSTHGKDPRRPRRSSSKAGITRATSPDRAFAVVVHGDAAGAETCAARWSTGCTTWS